MYVDLNEIHPDTLFQGDIINDFPFFIFDNLQLIRKSEDGTFIESGDQTQTENSLFALEAKHIKVLILSQTCDIQNRNNIIICPIYDIESLLEDGTLTEKRAESLRANKFNYWFHLPKCDALKESLADLQTIQYVPKNMLEKYKTNRLVSLDDLGRHRIGWFLANYFGRPIENK